MNKSTSAQRRKRLVALVKSLPEATAIPAGDRHCVWLDSPAPDWNEVGKRIEDAYRLTAPKQLAAILQATTNKTNP